METLVEKYRCAREQVFFECTRIEEHPWYGLLGPNQSIRDLDVLQRTIRFAFMQMSRFWVEFQSFPLFHQSLTSLSLHDIQALFDFFSSTPEFGDISKSPQLIATLANQEPLRRIVLECMQNIQSAHILIEELKESPIPQHLLHPAELKSLQKILTETNKAAHEAGITHIDTQSLSQLIQDLETRIQHAAHVRSIFKSWHDEFSLPLPSNLIEADILASLMHELVQLDPWLAWKPSSLILPNQRTRIQTWTDRAKPIIEMRRRLQICFDLDRVDAPSITELQELIYNLTQGGILKTIRSFYKDALCRYKELLRAQYRIEHSRESILEITEKLALYAQYLQQKEAFETNEEAKKLFHAGFQGIDTNFQEALEIHILAKDIFSHTESYKNTNRDTPEAASFVATLMHAISRHLASGKSFQSALTKELQSLRQPYGLNLSLMTEENTNLRQLQRLMKTAEELPIDTDLLSVLEERVADVLFLQDRISQQSTPLHQALGTHYRGFYTDTSLIEKAWAYVTMIHGSKLPHELKVSLLSSKGILRFEETKVLITSASVSLTSCLEHESKLLEATQSAFETLASCPFPELIQRMHLALKQPAKAADLIYYNQSLKELEEAGLMHEAPPITQPSPPAPQGLTLEPKTNTSQPLELVQSRHTSST